MSRAMIQTSALVTLLACQGQPGAPGDDGADGQPGEDGRPGEDGGGLRAPFSGVVRAAAGPAAGAPVAIWSLDRDGVPNAGLGATITDGEGRFSLHLADRDTPATDLWIVASTADGELSSLAVGQDITVDAASGAVTAIIRWILSSPEGRVTGDYTTAEVDELYTRAAEAIDAAGVDPADPAAAIDATLEALGGAIADASGGSWAPEARLNPVEQDPPDASGPGLGQQEEARVDGASITWEIRTRDGSLQVGDPNELNALGSLEVGEDSFYQAATTYTFEDSVEVVTGTLADLGTPGLEVYRKVYASPTYGYCRTLEVLSNTTGEDITVDLTFRGSLDFGEETDEASLTESGDLFIDASDLWAIYHSAPPQPMYTWIFPGAELEKSGHNLIFTVDDLVIGAGETRRLIHWALARPTPDIGEVAEELDGALDPDTGAFVAPSWYEYLTQVEVETVVAPLLPPNLLGGAGAVAPYATLTAENLDTGYTRTGEAGSDGSFALSVFASPGDSIRLIASDGTDETLTVP